MEQIDFKTTTPKRAHRRVTLDAVGRLQNSDMSLPCVIEDISAGGARIRLEDEAASQFFGAGWTLTSALTGDLPVDIRWRQVDAAGVSFDITPGQRKAIERLVSRLADLGLRDAFGTAPLRLVAGA